MKDENLVTLRRSTIDDLNSLFQFQLDPEANFLAAFTSEDPTDKAAYVAKFTKLFSEPTINNQTILVEGVIVGSIAKFEIEGDAELTYWIDRAYWGKGIATQALKAFLSIEKTRPIFGRAAFDNLGSQKVLLKSGFVKVGIDNGFANARKCEIEEYIYKLVE